VLLLSRGVVLRVLLLLVVVFRVLLLLAVVVRRRVTRLRHSSAGGDYKLRGDGLQKGGAVPLHFARALHAHALHVLLVLECRGLVLHSGGERAHHAVKDVRHVAQRLAALMVAVGLRGDARLPAMAWGRSEW
jgi:hypothetical protein